jgi:hypothetical protein
LIAVLKGRRKRELTANTWQFLRVYFERAMFGNDVSGVRGAGGETLRQAVSR